MEWLPRELDYKSANFSSLCKRPPNPYERHLNEDGNRGDYILWERAIKPGWAASGPKESIPTRGGWPAGGDFSHVDDKWHMGDSPPKLPPGAMDKHNLYGPKQIFHTVPSG